MLNPITLNLITILMLLLPVAVAARSARMLTGTIYMSSVDSLEALPDANVALLNVDSTFVKGVMTGDNGRFQLQFNSSKGKDYILRVSYTGMKVYFRNLPDTLADFNLGQIILESNTSLKEVVISAPMKIIDTNGDTTIINATAFKLREGASLKELVRRVPGLVYDRKEKTLTYNGISLNGICVNGEAFFHGKNDIAMENLSAEIIDKMKIYDKRSEEEEFTGVRRGDKENYVLDLKTKEKFNGTLMASAMVGAGNYDKKQLDADANYFKRNGENLSLVLNTGNKNSISPNKDSREDKGVMNITKAIGNGIRIHSSLGYNYQYNGTRKRQSYSEQYLITGNQYGHSENEGLSKNRNISGHTHASWQNKNTNVSFNASLYNSGSDGSNSNHEAIFTSPTQLPLKNPFDNDDYHRLPDSIRLNDAYLNSMSKSRYLNYSVYANVMQLLNNKGTSICFNISYNKSNGDNDNFAVSSITYYKLLNNLGNDSILYRNQYQHGPSGSHSVSASVDLSHRIRRVGMRLSYKYSINRQNDRRNTYDLSPFSAGDDQSLFFILPEGYESQYIDSLSNRSYRKTNTNTVQLSLDYGCENCNFMFNFSVDPLRETLYQKTGSFDADTVRHSTDYSAHVAVYYFKGKTNISLSYYGRTSQPSLSNLLTLTDNIDPLNITRGNPDLKSSYMQSVNFNARNTDIGLNGSFSFNNTYNSVTNAVTYNTITGGRESYPVNISGNYNGNVQVGYYKNFKNYFNMSAKTAYHFGNSVSMVNEGRKEFPDKSSTRRNSSSVSLMTSYNPHWGGFTLDTRWAFSHNVNSLRNTSVYSREYNISFDAFSDLPGNFQLRSDIGYSYRGGTYMTSDMNNQIIWNAGISWRFLKKRQAELSVEWFDILNDRKNYYRNVSSTSLSEGYSKHLGSYFMVSFKYRFNKIDKGSSRERRAGDNIRSTFIAD